jgi:chromosome segregation ATPase
LRLAGRSGENLQVDQTKSNLPVDVSTKQEQVESSLKVDVDSIRINAVKAADTPETKSDAFASSNNISSPRPDDNRARIETPLLNEYRQQMHQRWESEKKLQKKLSLIENRLKEKVDENNNLLNQLKHARETAQIALATKEELSKKVTAYARVTQESQKLTIEDLTVIEQTRSQLFSLEEENSRLKRRAEVELSNEIKSLQQQLAVARENMHELATQVEQAESLRKRAEFHGGNSLQASEDRFHSEERLKEDLILLRKQRAQLEAAVLEKDCRALENRFDLESKQNELLRLQRRLKEVEAAYQTSQAILTDQGNASVLGLNSKPISIFAQRQLFASEIQSNIPSLVGGRNNCSKRELELENVIDALKKVVEKLRSENERLRRGGVQEDERKLIELEKKANLDKKKADKLEAEVSILQAKMKEFDLNNQKLTQKQQQLVSIRKLMKAKEEEMAKLQVDIDALKDSLLCAESKIVSLEMKAQSEVTTYNEGTNVSFKVDTLKEAEIKYEERLQQQVAQLKDAVERGNILKGENEELKTTLVRLQQQLSTYEICHPRQEPDRLSEIEIRRLQEENDELRKELSVFDLEFFEEIENLKFAYSEALKKLKMYENLSNRKIPSEA